MDFAKLAKKEFRNYHIFRALARREKVPEFRETLEQLAAYEKKHYQFWQQLAPHFAYNLRAAEVGMFLTIRALFGLTFTIRLMELQEGELMEQVREHLFHSNHPLKKQMEEIIHVEEAAEQKLLGQIKEERVEFTGSIVLGLNDGLIEISGALTGFVFAFRDSLTVALAGFILGVSASMSMAASSYLQSRQDKGRKDPRKAAVYTGITYMVVVLILILPFILSPSNVYEGLGFMVLLALAVIISFSFYTSVIFRRNFRRSFLEMFSFSAGTAIVTFLIGTLARKVFGLEI